MIQELNKCQRNRVHYATLSRLRKSLLSALNPFISYVNMSSHQTDVKMCPYFFKSREGIKLFETKVSKFAKFAVCDIVRLRHQSCQQRPEPRDSLYFKTMNCKGKCCRIFFVIGCIYYMLRGWEHCFCVNVLQKGLLIANYMT